MSLGSWWWIQILLVVAVACPAHAAPRNHHRLVPLSLLGKPDRTGSGAQLCSNSVPASVDHSPSLPPVRDQGSRGTCLAHALTASLEGSYGLKDQLSVEQMWDDLKSGGMAPDNDVSLGTRLTGDALAKEAYWPYNGSPQPGLQANSIYKIQEVVSTGCDPDTLKQYLADPKTNVALGVAWVTDLERNGVLPNPQYSWAYVQWVLLTCNLFHDWFDDESCGGHAILLVGYADRVDSDGVTRTFFKFKNSWGGGWGDSGFGYMSSEYVSDFCVHGEVLRADPTVPGQPGPDQPPNTNPTPPPPSKPKVYDPDYCSAGSPCGPGEGNCHDDAECLVGLTCTKDGTRYHAPVGVAVCVPKPATQPPPPPPPQTEGTEGAEPPAAAADGVLGGGCSVGGRPGGEWLATLLLLLASFGRRRGRRQKALADRPAAV